jgi:uncharacterized membrane protein (DUF373 family)
VITILTVLIAVVIASAVWHLTLKILSMIFTAIIALEFKRSLLVATERRTGIVQVRTVILLATLAVVRKLIILDLHAEQPMQVFALGAASLALGAVYWLVRDQDRRERAPRDSD